MIEDTIEKQWIKKIGESRCCYKGKEIKRDFKTDLSFTEEFWIVVKWCKKIPEVVEKIIKIANKIKKRTKDNWIKDMNCLFPESCNEFPCDTLTCNADTCDNGHAFRWS